MTDSIDYVERSYLEKEVSKNTVKVAIRRNRNRVGKWDTCKCPRTGSTLVDVRTITKFIEKHNIQLPSNIQSDPFFPALEFALNTERNQYLKTYQTTFKYNFVKALEHAKYHALWLAIFNLSGGGNRATRGTLRRLYDAYKVLEIKHRRNSYKSFSDFRSDFAKHLLDGGDVYDFMIHGMLGKKNALKYTEWHVARVFLYYAETHKHPAHRVAQLVNKNAAQAGQLPIDESVVRNIYRKHPELKNIADEKRHGAKYYNDHHAMYLIRSKPKGANSLWQIDGTPAQFWCTDENGRTIRPYMFTVMDISSDKILGLSIGKSEDMYAIMSALQMAVKLTGQLPGEILSDNFSSGKTEQMKYLVSCMESMGVIIRKAKVGNAQDKGHMERWYRTFQSRLQSLSPLYLGEGITSKSLQGRRAKEDVSAAYKMHGTPTLPTMKKEIIEWVSAWNGDASLKGVSPNERYKQSEKPFGIDINAAHVALLFWKTTEATVRNCYIKLTVRKQKYHYLIKANELRHSLAGKKVRVRYDENDLSDIMIFNYKTDEVLTSVPQYIGGQVSTVEQTEEEKKEIYKLTARKKSAKAHREEKFENLIISANVEDLPLTKPYELIKDNMNNEESRQFRELGYAEMNVNQTTETEPVDTLHRELPQYGRSINKSKENKKSVPGDLKIVGTDYQ